MPTPEQLMNMYDTEQYFKGVNKGYNEPPAELVQDMYRMFQTRQISLNDFDDLMAMVNLICELEEVIGGRPLETTLVEGRLLQPIFEMARRLRF